MSVVVLRVGDERCPAAPARFGGFSVERGHLGRWQLPGNAWEKLRSVSSDLACAGETPALHGGR
jgi:hypothetical protein